MVERGMSIRPARITVDATNSRGELVAEVFDVDGDRVEYRVNVDYSDDGPFTDVIETHSVTWETRRREVRQIKGLR